MDIGMLARSKNVRLKARFRPEPARCRARTLHGLGLLAQAHDLWGAKLG